MEEDKKYVVTTYNSVTKVYEEVEVSEVVYNFYRRSGWNIEDQEQRIKKKEILFSNLKGGDNEAYENFEEFISSVDNPENIYLNSEQRKLLFFALSLLCESEQSLIQAIYFQNKTEAEYAEEIGMSQQRVHYRKKRILEKIKQIVNF